MRKRYSVVVRGVGGTVRDQTSEISRHRSETAAREAAEVERHRLFVVRPEEALNYRISVYRDDRELILDEPALTGATAPLPQGPERDLSALTGRPAPAGADAGEAPVPAAPPVDAEGDEGETGRAAIPARGRLHDEPLPEGRVPEDVIARFAQSLEREERRRDRSG